MPATYTDLKEIQVQGRRKNLKTGTREYFDISPGIAHTYYSEVVSPMNREVLV